MLATGIGSWPGTDIGHALKVTFAECPQVPYLPELPARGAGADLVGRGVAMLLELSADLQPAGWRLTGAPGRDQLRARSLLRDDLDLLEERAQGYEGPFKIAVAGPWTLAASVERPRGGRVLGDEGARRELGQSLAAGMAELLGELRRRLPGLEPIVQVDEPLLPAVAAGQLATVSGYSQHRPVEPPELSALVTEMVRAITATLGETTGRASTTERSDALPTAWMHCCAPGVPFRLLADAGVGGFLVDPGQLGTDEWDVVGQLVSDGRWLGAGVLNTSDGAATDESWSVDALAQRMLRLIDTLGLEPDAAARMLVTPACGLARFEERSAVTALRSVGKAAGIVTEELGG